MSEPFILGLVIGFVGGWSCFLAGFLWAIYEQKQ